MSPNICLNARPIDWEKVAGIYQYFGDSMLHVSVAKKKKKIRDNRKKEREMEAKNDEDSEKSVIKKNDA